MTRKASTSTHSRRTVIKAAAAGTAAMGLLAATRAVGGGAATTTDAIGMPVVAFVSDARRGELVVMVGTREIVRRDADLVGRLIAIAKEATDVLAS